MKTLDCYAAEMIPIRLIISISLIAAIMLLATMGLHSAQITQSEHQLENQINQLKAELFTLLKSGSCRDIDIPGAPLGTTREIELSLPENLCYLSFGVDPDSDNNGHLETGLTDEGRVICYQIDGGSKHIEWLDDEFMFREGFMDDTQWMTSDNGYIIDTSGKVSFLVEFVKHQEKQILLIHAQDGYR